MVKLAPSPFEIWAVQHGYDIARAVLPDSRVYADRRTQEVYEAWTGGAHWVARILTESTIDSPALREKIRALAGDA